MGGSPIMTEGVSDKACCLGCGYLLRDLPNPICPECGRGFDPLDEATYDAHPVRRRRRRRIRSMIIGAVIGGLLVSFVPRKLATSSITFTCATCNHRLTVKRFEPFTLHWLPIRYPGFSWTTQPVAGTTKVVMPPPCTIHAYGISVVFEMPIGLCTGSCSGSVGSVPVINGQDVTPETASSVLEAMMNPDNMGSTITTGPAAATGG